MYWVGTGTIKSDIFTLISTKQGYLHGEPPNERKPICRLVFECDLDLVGRAQDAARLARLDVVFRRAGGGL